MVEGKRFTRFKNRYVVDATITSLRYTGLWTRDSTCKLEILYKFYNGLIILTVCLFAVTVFADLCLNYNDLIIFTDDGCILAGICVIIFKIYNFGRRRRRVELAIETIHAPIDILNLSSDAAVRSVVENCSFYEKLLLHAFWTIGGILSFALIFLVPVEDGQLPIRAKYPFDVTKYPMYYVAFFVQACAVSVGLIAIIGMDSIVIGLYKWVSVQLVILNSNFENCAVQKSKRATVTSKDEPLKIGKKSDSHISCFVSLNPRENSVARGDDSFVKRLKTCIKHHQRIIAVIDELNDLFGSSMSVQLIASFSMICFTGFQAASGANNLTSLLKFGFYLGAAFSQLLNWCWTGNSLMYQSASLSTSQWFSGWEDYEGLRISPLIIISLMRSKKPLTLQAGKFYTMSMQTFIAILRSSYSFFALLTEISG